MKHGMGYQLLALAIFVQGIKDSDLKTTSFNRDCIPEKTTLDIVRDAKEWIDSEDFHYWRTLASLTKTRALKITPKQACVMLRRIHNLLMSNKLKRGLRRCATTKVS